MDRRVVVVGAVLLLGAVVYFYFAEAFRVSDGTMTILWANIFPGIVLALVGVVVIAWGLMHKKGKA